MKLQGEHNPRGSSFLTPDLAAHSRLPSIRVQIDRSPCMSGCQRRMSGAGAVALPVCV